MGLCLFNNTKFLNKKKEVHSASNVPLKRAVHTTK